MNGGPFPDRAGCLGSYKLDGEPVEVELPEGSSFYRMNRKRMKIYGSDPVLGSAMEDLREIPEGVKRATVEASHGSHSSSYSITWE
ncbi:MAG: hypothetical protein DRO99_03420 [Candidatus Aenigmatarchaeota archaeon]|nr:MAG: hypothetical protein DRO99_03420 [Candidatus Aenigmarchaeota archaeon]